MQEIRPFEFKECVSIIKSTGKRAKSLKELREEIATVGKDCIFHHTYQYFLKGHILEYTNDFAQWAGEGLEERGLSERLSNIDPYGFREIDTLRGELLRVIDEFLETSPEPREAVEGGEFYFNEPVTIAFPVGIRARNLAEFLTAAKYIDQGTFYFHFYDARTRLGSGADDFSKWFEEELGRPSLAARIRSIDPFMHTVEGIRAQILAAVEEEVRRDMEAGEAGEEMK